MVRCIKIALSSIFIYVFIVLGLRLFGKKELAQLSIFDLVFILLLSNAVQNSMVGADSSLTGGVVAATSLFIFNYIVKIIIFKFPKFGKVLQGEPLIIIYNGVLINKNVKKAKLTHEEIMEAIREHGAVKISNVDLAVLEVDGNISVLSEEFKARTSSKRQAHKVIRKNEK